jgi:hypothetical protein
MNDSMVIDVPVTSPVLMMPVLEVVRQIQQLQSAAMPQQLPTLIEDHFAWFSQENKQTAFEHMEATLLADRLQLWQQVQFNMAELIRYVTKDVAERVCALAAEQSGYRMSCSYHPTVSESAQTFKVPIGSTTSNTRLEWVYERVEHFDKMMMPLRALQAMIMLEDFGLVPPAYWVADKIETQIFLSPSPQRRSLDPVLYAQYGHWFAGIAEWA